MLRRCGSPSDAGPADAVHIVSLVAPGNFSVDKMVAGKNYALSETASSFFGQAGFVLIPVGAMLPTASTITMAVAAEGAYRLVRREGRRLHG